MSIIQIIILLVVALVWWRLWARLQSGEMRMGQFLEWWTLWLVIGLVALLPDTASYLARVVGVGRGSDLVTYLALLLLFYLLFKIFVRLERTDRQLTKVVRELALQDTQVPPDASFDDKNLKFKI